MDVQDGFIVGIYNYCDRWCEACEFTSHCRVFADLAEAQANLDPGMRPVLDAPPLPEEIPPPPPRWMQEIINEMNDASREPMSKEEWERLRPKVAPEHRTVEARAHLYRRQVHVWLHSREFSSVHDPTDPRAVVGWFHTLIPAKIHRALTGLASHAHDDRNWPPDHDGSAKVALLGIERSHAAWLDLVERGLISAGEAAPFIADLVWLGEEVERILPNSRAFIRPAFDEPEAVTRMRSS